MALEHGDALVHGHVDLLADGHEAAREVLVVAHHEPHRDHEVVDVVEDERVLAAVDALALEEVHWVVSPVAEGIEVVGCVVAVVVTVSIALSFQVRSW